MLTTKKQNSKFTMKMIKISNKSPSESLTNGIAERVFREVKNHQNRYLSLCGHTIEPNKLIEFLNQEFTRRDWNQNSKKKTRDRIVNTFICAIKGIPYCPPKPGESISIVYGTLLKNDRLFVVSLLLDNKRPHRSEIFERKITISKHGLARIIYRYRPANLEQLMINVSAMLEEIIITIDKFNNIIVGEKKWLYLPGHGGFLIGKIDDKFVLITFINENLMTDEQKWEAERTLETIKNIHIGLFHKIKNDKCWRKESEYLEVCNTQ